MNSQEAIELLPVLDGEMNTSLRRLKSLLSHMERHAYFDQEDVDAAADVAHLEGSPGMLRDRCQCNERRLSHAKRNPIRIREQRGG